MRETFPHSAVDWMARMVLPPGASTAPRMKFGVAPRAAVESLSQGFGGGLAGEVHLQGAVDGHHVVLAGDHQGVVGVIDGPELDGGIVVEVFVGRLVAHAEGGHGLAPVEGLAAVVDDPFLHQLHHSVAQQFGVDAQVVLLAQIGEDRVGQAAVPDLNRVAVLDDPGHVLADLVGDVVRHRPPRTPGAARHGR